MALKYIHTSIQGAVSETSDAMVAISAIEVSSVEILSNKQHRQGAGSDGTYCQVISVLILKRVTKDIGC